MQPSLLAERLLGIALDLFRERGYAQVSPGDVAAAASCSLDELYRHFPRKESFILRLYERLAGELEGKVPELPAGTLSQRFAAVMQAKLALIERHRDLFRFLLPAGLDPENRLAVLGPHVERIRSRVQGIFSAVALGARDAPPAEQLPRFVRFLYALHLGLVFLALQDQTSDRKLASEGTALVADLVGIAQRFLLQERAGFLQQLLASMAGLPRLGQIGERLDRLVGNFVQPPHDPAHYSLAENLLRDLFRHRRLQPGAGACAADPCPQCLALHLPRVQAFIAAGQPIHMVLPAFPAKSANLRKVTGPLPDLGEELALRFLQERCDAIAARYPPGAKLTLCSDGRVFNDLVGVTDEAVTAYRLRLLEMIRDMQLQAIDVFDLDDVRPGADFGQMRAWLIEQYGEPLEALHERTRQFEHHRHLFNGLHRFLFEDLAEREPGLSRTQARNLSKDLAYEVIRRSNAWGKLIAVYFPEALRLSIHPQPPHAEKIGILLTPAEDNWLTPWHGVALLTADGFVLTRRAEAEARGARLVLRDGRPSHFEAPGASATTEVPHAH